MPELYVFGGPNGAGKSTTAREVLPGVLKLADFVNADVIASGLSLRPETVARQAGRVMLGRIRELIDSESDFAFESTLASRSFAPLLRECLGLSYEVHLLYVWLRSPELAVRRVEARVKSGGHSVPDNIVRRRYARSLHNALTLYFPLATTWVVADNSDADHAPQVVARGGTGMPARVLLPDQWASIEAAAQTAAPAAERSERTEQLEEGL
jgi:predicted ABC-type ATPase